MTEFWKDISGYEGIYYISNYSNIRRNKKPVKQHRKKEGYLYADLCKKGIRKKFYVHRMVAIAFISNPDNKPQINHIDGVKNNNRVENLEWVTIAENSIHAWNNRLNIPKGNMVLNIETGIYYDTITEAAYTHSIQMKTLHRRITKGINYCAIILI